MALEARKTLQDCEIALVELEKHKRGNQAWRVQWVACLALLRSVGNVLRNVDGKADARRRAAIDAAWSGWKKKETGHAIFSDFIKAGRDNVIKEYQFGVVPEPINVVVGGVPVVVNGNQVVTAEEYFRLTLKRFENRDGREVIREAINWWKAELDRIEKQA